MRWHEVTGETLPPVVPCAKAGELDVQIVRTIPEHIYDAVPRRRLRHPRVVHARLQGRPSAHLPGEPVPLVARDRRRSRGQAAATPRIPTSGCCSCCPPSRTPACDDTRGVLGELIEADGDAGRLLACTLYARAGRLADPIYVHAKVGIIDDNWLTLGSANLNEHSLFNDTEMNLVTHDPDLASAHPAAALGRASRAPDRPDPGRSDRGNRRALEADQRRTARPPQRAANHSPTGSSACRTSRGAPGAPSVP